jgi:MFS family permease
MTIHVFPADRSGSKTRRVAPRAGQGTGPFAALADSQYQRYSIAALLSTVALVIESLARAWLLQRMTGSALVVSLVPALLMLPMLFLSVPGGELADRFSRKTITLAYEALALGTYAVLAYLVMAGTIQPWHVLAATALQGIGAALSAPARQTLITDLVSTRQQRGAIGLSMVVSNLAAILGPAAGGLLIARYGMAHAFLAAAIVAVPALPIYLSLKPASAAARLTRRGPMLGNLKDGLHYISGDASLKWLLLACVVMIVTVNSWGALFPAFAENVLKVGAGGLGVISTAVGGGSLLATLLMVVVAGRIPDKTVEVVSGFLFAAFALGVAVSSSYLLSIGLVAMAAFAATSFFQTNLTAVQLHAPEEYRGRVISVRFVAWGLQPIGLLALGGLAEVIGPQPALAGFALAGALLFGILVIVLRPHHVRRLAEMQAAGGAAAASRHGRIHILGGKAAPVRAR